MDPKNPESALFLLGKPTVNIPNVYKTETINNRIVSLKLRDKRVVKLLINHPWLLNGNYSTITSVLIADLNGNYHTQLATIILQNLKPLLPIVDVSNKKGYSVYKAYFRRIDGTNKMYLYLKDFKYFRGDVLKFPTSDGVVPIDSNKLSYTNPRPLGEFLAASTKYMIPRIVNDLTDVTKSDILIGSYDFPYTGELPPIHVGEDKRIIIYELTLTYCSMKFLIDSSKVSIANDNTRTYYKLGGEIYHTRNARFNNLSKDGYLYNSREVKYLRAIYLEDLDPDIELNTLSVSKEHYVYVYTPKNAVPVYYLFKHTEISKGVRQLKLREDNIVKRLELKDGEDFQVYLFGIASIDSQSKIFKYIINRKVQTVSNQEFTGIVTRHITVPNEYLMREPTKFTYIRQSTGKVKYFNYGKFAIIIMKPKPEFADLNLNDIYIIETRNSQKNGYYAKKMSLNITRVIKDPNTVWEDLSELREVLELTEMRPEEVVEENMSRYDDGTAIVLELYRSNLEDGKFIITTGQAIIETTEIYNYSPGEDLIWTGYDAAINTVRSFLSPFISSNVLI